MNVHKSDVSGVRWSFEWFPSQQREWRCWLTLRGHRQGGSESGVVRLYLPTEMGGGE